MLLLIDAGNTRIKWAVTAPGAVAGKWLASGVVSQVERANLTDQWQDLAIDAVLVSNVAGAEVRAALTTQLQVHATRHDLPLTVTWFHSTASLAGVRNRYRDPGSLGCDRFASLIGARASSPGRCLIVATCGTATTVDALDAHGDFIGGLILPGLGLMAASLAQRTAQLPHIAAASAPAHASLDSSFADNTQDAIHSGCLAAQAGAIERAVAAHGGAHCLLSGGAAAWIAPCLAIPFTLVENLVLIGLHAVAQALPVTTAAQAPPCMSTTISSITDTTGADRSC